MKRDYRKPKTQSILIWFLKHLLYRDDFIEFRDNLDEVYNCMVQESGRSKASRWYWFRFMESLPWIVSDYFHWRINMIKNNLKLAIRSFKKDKFHSFINVIGLTIGITFSIIIFLLIQNDLSTDKHHQKAERIFRYGVNMTIGGRTSTQVNCHPGVGPLLKREISEIESFVRLFQPGDISIKKGNNTFLEKNMWVSDNSIFEIFSHEFLYGSPDHCLKDPNTLVLTEQISQKMFGKRNPIGGSVELEGWGLFTVTGVIRNLPDNTHLKFDGLLSFATIEKKFDPARMLNPANFSGNMSYTTYFLFKVGFTPEDFGRKFAQFYKKQMAATDRINYKSVVEPLTSIYLNSKIWTRYSQRNRVFLLVFSAIGFFLLALACINYINLATSRFSGRAKEIGLKKVVGAEKKQLISQFLTESLILSFISLILALLLVKFILTFTPFNQLIQKSLEFDLFGNPLLLIGSLLITLLTGLLSGIYPSFYLARVSPANILKNYKTFSPGKSLIRNGLVAFQFTISIAILIMTFLMNNQMKFVQDFNPGFNKNNVVLVSVNNKSLLGKMEAFKKEITGYHGVESAAFSTAYPGYNIEGWAFKWETEEGEMKGHAFRHMRVDSDYFKTLGITVIKGRNFKASQRGTDSRNLIVNEALVKHLGWSDPIGKRAGHGTVIGVVNDFNYDSLHTDIRPMYITLPREIPSILNARIHHQYTNETMDFINKKWKQFFPSHPIYTTFLDQEMDRLYRNDIRQMGLIRIFSLVCILICCLGLLGLISYSTEKRTREIAVRKVLGASIPQIITNLFKPILIIVFWALVIASPIAYFLGHSWLKNFVYKSDISPVIFLLSGLVAIFIAFLTASYHSIRVAVKKPVETLKYE